MKLTLLRPQFHRYERRQEVDPTLKPAGGDWGDPCWREVIVPVDILQEAQGMWFLCPACYAKNNGPKGTHRIMVTFDGCGVSDAQGNHDRNGKPLRWKVSGNRSSDLSLYPSIDCGCWHGWIKRGTAS